MTAGDLAPERPSPLSRVWRWADGLARLSFTAVAAPTVLALFARLHWFLDNLTSFTVQYAAAAMLSVAAFLVLRRPWWAAAACVVVAANLVQLWSAPHDEPPTKGEPLRIVSANIHWTNREFDRVLAFVRETRPDVLLVVECTPAWEQALDPLRAELPHIVAVPRDDPFGIALFSRLPFETTELLEAAGTGFPSIVARLRRGDQTLTVVGTHPPPPISAAASAARNSQLADLASLARRTEGEVLLLGDLNVSPWSPHFQDLLNAGGLADTRRGFGAYATWPVHRPPMLTPIDHVLISDGLIALDRSVGPNVGSDHYPVVATVAFRGSTGDR